MNQLITHKTPPLGVHKRNFQISYDLTSNTEFLSSNKKKSKPSPPDKTNESTSDQASELSTLDTNTDKFQSMMGINNSTLKSEILSSFKAELNNTLTSNNYALSLKISNDVDNKFMQFQSYLMNLVKELVTEMNLLRTSSIPSTNVPSPTMLPPSSSPPMQVFPSSQHPGGYENFLLHNSCTPSTSH